MKQNPCPVVGEVAKPTGIGLDELDCTIETFRTGIADSVLAEVEQPFFVAPEHLDNLFDGLQLAAHRVVRPGLEEAFGRTLVAVAPELAEVLLDAPGLLVLRLSWFRARNEMASALRPSGYFFSHAHLLPVSGDVACLGQLAVLLLPYRIDCLAEVLGDVKLVMHDVGLRHALFGSTHVCRPHVHGHRLDRCALRRRERFQQAHWPLQAFSQEPSPVPASGRCRSDAGVSVASFRTLLIDAEVRNLFFGTTQHAAFHGTDHDSVDRTPGQSCERADSLGGRAGLKQLDNKAGHQCGDAAVTLRPGHHQFLDRAVTVFELGNACLDEGLKLAGIKVTPLALAPPIDVGPLGRISGITPHLALLQNDFDHHTLLGQAKVYAFDRPRRLQSKKLLIQRGVFHLACGNFEKLDCLAVSEKSQ
jgi:hypothetical protein